MPYDLCNRNEFKASDINALRDRFRRNPSTAELVRHIMATCTENYLDIHLIFYDVFRIGASQTHALAGWWKDVGASISDETLDRLMLIEIQSKKHLWDVEDETT